MVPFWSDWSFWQTVLMAVQTVILFLTALVVWKQLGAQVKSVEAQAVSTGIQTKAMQAETAMRLDDVWDSSEYRNKRARVAKMADPDQPDLGLTFEEMEIADFFEAMGTYLETQAIDEKYVDALFGYYIQGYWTILSATIEKYRKDSDEPNPEAYTSFQRANEVINAGKLFSANTVKNDFLRLESVVAD